ncbi:MAG: hypothetical protein SFW67_09770 [Myxococcaceae bacterium]|nr:hypothetical protein [Myxococcaceae bacterium]
MRLASPSEGPNQLERAFMAGEAFGGRQSLQLLEQIEVEIIGPARERVLRWRVT